MVSPPSWTATRLRVLRILAGAGEPLWPLDVARGTGIAYGSVYDTFRRLYDVGWAVGITEDNKGKGRPARVLYRLTKKGRTQAAKILGEETTT